jgi:tetratricopeptide (TPR) repeat protein
MVLGNGKRTVAAVTVSGYSGAVAAASSDSVLINNRYQLLAELGQGGMGVVYRAKDRLTGELVALKQVTAEPGQLQFNSSGSGTNFRLRLANEFKTLASLRHPHIISVLDYGFDDKQQPYFTMDLLENVQTILAAGRQVGLERQVQLLVQALQALAYLHRRGIIHRDLKPDNILVSSEQVRVVDFGVALAPEADLASRREMAGTLAYMAPEVLMGAPAEEASDLFAIGVIAYELFTGSHPFLTGQMGQLLSNILAAQPDLRLLEARTHRQLVPIVAKLLARKPEDRFTSVRALILAYSEATGQTLPYETASTRESFLQAATFVAREKELAQLSAAFEGAEHHRGSSWLIGGESGVGKSRLLDEVRTLALVRGGLVLRGQAISEGGLPYQLWREAMSHLILQVELSDFDAGVLKAIVPNVAQLLDRPIADVAELDPQSSQARLLQTVEGLFRRLRRPTLLLLEDLQWAGSESLTLLARLNRRAGEWPLLILGSYRHDERPELADQLRRMERLILEPLPPAGVEALVVSMVGTAGARGTLIDQLTQESEGNTFFLVEVVRALAEQAGGLESIGYVTLPDHLFSGGIRPIVQRRLAQVPAEARPLLNLAAAAGGLLPLELLQLLAPEVKLPFWLEVCANAAILVVVDGVWRFAHDKMREGVLAQLTAEERQGLHGEVAAGYERLYPAATRPNTVVAYHWAQAGNREKEAHYAGLAGEQAVRSGAYREAIQLLQRALELQPAIGPEIRARRHRLIGVAYSNLGELATAYGHYRQALVALERSDPGVGYQQGFDLLRHLGRQGVHRLRPGGVAVSQSDERLREAALTYGEIGTYAFLRNEVGLLIYCLLANLNLSEQLGSAADLARAYSSMCVVAGVIPWHGLAGRYQQLALGHMGLSAEADSYALSRVSIYNAGAGRLELAGEQARRGVKLASELGAPELVMGCLVVGACAAYWQGKLAEADGLYGELTAIARSNGDNLRTVWGVGGQSVCKLQRGQTAEAIRLGEASLELVLKNPEPTSLINRYGVLALAYWQQGEAGRAGELVKLALKGMDEAGRPAVYTVLEGYAAAAETALALWEAQPEAAGEWAVMGRRFGRHLQSYAGIFGIGQPVLWRCRGLLAWLERKEERAQQAWAKGLALAQQLGMRQEEGLAHYEMGRHGAAGHLEEAIAIFRETGASYYLAQASRVNSDQSSVTSDQ